MIPIYYFSASGNTKYCVELVQRGFHDKNMLVELINIKSVRHLPFPDPNSLYPAIGIAFPVYEFMVPRIILIWLKKLPKAKKITPFLIIDTSGGLPCNSAGVAMDLLRQKNYEPLGVLEIPTPTAEPFFSNKYYPVGWTQEILDKCYFFGSLVANRLKKEKKDFIDLRLGRLRFARLTNYFYQYFLKGQSSSAGMLKYNPSKCNQCGACENICPMAAIDIKKLPKPFNDNRCMLCANCVRICPNHAITISYRPKKIPPSAKETPKSRPGYIDPKKYHPSSKQKHSTGYLKLLFRMMKKKS